MKVGIIGLPNAGKSTLFNAVTGGHAPTAGYPFTTVDPNVSRVSIPDPRLERVAEAEGSARIVPAYLEMVDIAGLVQGASRGEGLGNRFLAYIREADALVHVLRAFESGDVAHVAGSVDPVRDSDIVNTELMLADLETVHRRLEKTEKPARAGDAGARADLEALREIEDRLARGVPVRMAGLPERAAALCREMLLITRLPVLYAVNTDQASEDTPPGLVEDGPVLLLSARWEEELGELDPGEAGSFRDGPPPLDRLVITCYRLLDLITFFTANENQATAWRLPRGQTAWDAAGRVHTAMQDGFIRAEVVSSGDLTRAGSFAAARNQGLSRVAGRDYEVGDGDILFFRFRA